MHVGKRDATRALRPEKDAWVCGCNFPVAHAPQRSVVCDPWLIRTVPRIRRKFRRKLMPPEHVVSWPHTYVTLLSLRARRLNVCRLLPSSFFILHPSSFILHPSSFILHPSSCRTILAETSPFILGGTSSWRQPWDSQQGYGGWSWTYGSWNTHVSGRHEVELQELRYRQQEQIGVYDLCVEKIESRCPEASHGPVKEDCSRWKAGEPRLSAPGGSLRRDPYQAMAMQTGDGEHKACKAKLAKLEAVFEGNARGRRGLRGRESCDSCKDCRNQVRHGREQTCWCAHLCGQRTPHTRSSAHKKRRSLSGWSRSQTWRSRASSASYTTWKLHQPTPQQCKQRWGWATQSTPSVGCCSDPNTSSKRTLSELQSGVPGHCSFCTAQGGASCLRGSGAATRTSRRPPEETVRETGTEGVTAHDNKKRRKQRSR